MSNLTQAEIQKCYKAGALTAERAMELMEKAAQNNRLDRVFAFADANGTQPKTRRRKSIRTKHSNAPWTSKERDDLVTFITNGNNYEAAARVFGRSWQACATQFRHSRNEQRAVTRSEPEEVTA